jgi:hypothetical protein
LSQDENERLVPAASIYTGSEKNSIQHVRESRESNNIPSSLLLQHQQRRSYFNRGTFTGRNTKYSTSTTTTPIISSTTTASNDEDETCSQKKDGYYQNWSSDCTSYYFCAAGYQLTYVCPPGKRFNGKKCEEDYTCPLKPGYNNPCGKKPNGYYAYPSGRNAGKYFYCFQKAKVIELQCELGKVFIGGKCSEQEQHKSVEDRVENAEQVSIVPLATLKQSSSSDSSPYKVFVQNTKPESSGTTISIKSNNENETCLEKSNGFYTERKGGCSQYYYCINGEKTGLRCQPDYVFNGDLCVFNSRFSCPYNQIGILVHDHDDEEKEE